MRRQAATDLDELYRRHGRDAARLAYLLTGDRCVAEDLAHDAFVRIAGKLTQVRDPQAFGAYLRRTVVNLSKMHFRRKAIERRYTGDSSLRGVQDDDNVVVTEALRKALLALPHRQRSAIVLRYYADVPDEEAAEILGCAVPTIRSLISRGMSALRDAIGSDVDA